MSVQALLIVAGGLGLLLSTISLVRRQLLSIRYGLGWLSVSLLAIAGAPVLDVLSRHVSGLGLTATGFSLGVFAGFLGLICLQLSISLSGLQHSIQDLTEHAALVEERLRCVEGQLDGDAAGAGREAARR